MSNFLKYQLEELEIEAKFVPEVLKCLFHTIIFHRALNIHRPIIIHSLLLHPLSFASVVDLNSEYVDQWSNIERYHEKLQHATAAAAAAVATDGGGSGSGGSSSSSGSSSASSKIRASNLQTQQEITKLVNDSISRFAAGVLKKVPSAAIKRQQQQQQHEPSPQSLNVAPQRHQIELSFIDTVQTKGLFGMFGETQAEIERWTILLMIKNPHEIAQLYDVNSGAIVLNSLALQDASTRSDKADERPSSTSSPWSVLDDVPPGNVERAPKELVHDVEKRLKMIIRQAHEKTDHLPSMTEDKLTLGPGCLPFQITVPSLGETSSGWSYITKFLLNK